MIVFHEGLPGAGKSYEACVFHIIPALQSGRRVVTNIEGINHAKFAELLNIAESMIRQFLICVYDHDVEKQKECILRESQKDSLVVLDEIQNLFPSGRDKLDDAWNKYISEHRHEGLDIVLMGQDRRDCHNMWRRRIQRVITFKKMTALGRNDSYAWACLEAVGPEKFKQVTSGSRKYEEKYFGLYQSFTDGTHHKTVYTDSRATVWNHWGFKYGIPAFLVALVWAGFNLTQFFKAKEPQPVYSATVKQNAPQKSAPVAQQRQQEKKPEKPEYNPVDVFDKLQHENTVRLSGVVIAANGDPEKLFAYVDILDKSFHLRERFTVAALRDMGYIVNWRESGLEIKKGSLVVLARPWPIDHPGRVDDDTRSTLSASQRFSAEADSRGAAAESPIFIGSSI